MAVISFAWTIEAFLSGRKSCTRRYWNAEYASQFHKGDIFDAYDRSARNGGKKMGLAQLTCTPYQERTGKFPPDDYENEGFQWMEEQGLLLRGITPREYCNHWIKANDLVYVVRFTPIKLSVDHVVIKGGLQLALSPTIL